MARRHDVAQYGEGGAPLYDRLQISPMRSQLSEDGTVQFAATVRDRAGELVTVTSEVAWQTSDSTIAVIDAAGLLTAIALGEITIYASLDSLRAQATILVQGDDVLYTVTSLNTTDYSAADNELVRVGDDLTVTLPAAAASYSIIIKNQTDETLEIVVAPTGSDTIDGQETITMLSGRGSMTLYSDKISDWMVT